MGRPAYPRPQFGYRIELSGLPLPPSGEVHRGSAGDDTGHQTGEQVAVRLPAVILAPCHLSGVAVQVQAADVVVLAPLRPTQAGEETFRLIGAGVVVAVGQRVIDLANAVAGAQLIPG